MNDVAVIDRFLDVFSRYIDSGFGLLGGEVRFLTATLVVIDVTLAGLYWAMSHASGQGDDVIARLVKKVLYVGRSPTSWAISTSWPASCSGPSPGWGSRPLDRG